LHWIGQPSPKKAACNFWGYIWGYVLKSNLAKFNQSVRWSNYSVAVAPPISSFIPAMLLNNCAKIFAAGLNFVLKVPI
jgi:hypothetical protein